MREDEQVAYSRLERYLSCKIDMPSPPPLPLSVPGFLLISERVAESPTITGNNIGTSNSLQLTNSESHVTSDLPETINQSIIHVHTPNRSSSILKKPKLTVPQSPSVQHGIASNAYSHKKCDESTPRQHKDHMSLNNMVDKRHAARLAKWSNIFHFDEDDEFNMEDDDENDRGKKLLRRLDDRCISIDQEAHWDFTLTQKDESLSMIIPEGFPRHNFANVRNNHFKPYTDHYHSRRSVGFTAFKTTDNVRGFKRPALSTVSKPPNDVQIDLVKDDQSCATTESDGPSTIQSDARHSPPLAKQAKVSTVELYTPKSREPLSIYNTPLYSAIDNLIPSPHLSSAVAG